MPRKKTTLTPYLIDLKKILQDPLLMSFDLDVQSIHLRLLAMAWDAPQPGKLKISSNEIRKIFSISESDWDARVFPALSKIWLIKSQEWIMEGLSQEHKKQNLSATRKKAAQERWNPSSSAEIHSFIPLPQEDFVIHNSSGVDVTGILQGFCSVFDNEITSIERSNIWLLGVQLLVEDLKDQKEIQKARAFLGKLIHQYGASHVSAVVSDLSLKPVPPAEAKSYLTASLRNKNKGTTSGVVL